MRRSNIRLLGDSGFLRWTDEDDARSKLQSGFWEERYDRSTGKFLGISKIEFHPKPSDSNSPAAITARESMANVGIWDGKAVIEGGKVPTGMLDAAESKIKCWPFEGDDKSVRASCLASA